MFIRLIIPVLFLIINAGCSLKNNSKPDPEISTEIIVDSTISFIPAFRPFGRDSIIVRLKNKIEARQPLIVHVFVPLCDNIHQGIVPVSDKLGDGSNPQTNLYWGAAYGVKTYFKQNGWILISSELNFDNAIPERIIFSRTLQDKTKIYLIADAYSGDQMESCLNDLFHSITGEKKDTIRLDSFNMELSNETDLFAFTGHNGLMDTGTDYPVDTTIRTKDVIILACISNEYFSLRLNNINAYPLLTTKSLMAPEAYVLNATILAWANMEPQEIIYNEACSSYSKYQKCSIGAAKTVFKTGW